jgi:hypothetical protein
VGAGSHAETILIKPRSIRAAPPMQQSDAAAAAELGARGRSADRQHRPRAVDAARPGTLDHRTNRSGICAGPSRNAIRAGAFRRR